MKCINLVNPVNSVNSVKKCARQGFTIVELLVAMSLLVMLLGLSGMVFNTTVAAHRAAGATIDVSRNLRAVTEQLNTDFRGLQQDAPLAMWFEYDPTDERYYDQIQFFANGDFQTTKQYDDGNGDKTLYGNMARIYYGHAWLVDNAQFNQPMPEFVKKGYRPLSTGAGDSLDRTPSNILARRAHVLTNENVPWFPLINDKLVDISAVNNNTYEYDTVSLTEWKQLLTDEINSGLYLYWCFNNRYTSTGIPFSFLKTVGRPVVGMDNFGVLQNLHNLLAQGVIQMQIQWAYTNDDLLDSVTGLPPDPVSFTGIRWWPSADPAGDGTLDSDFETMKQNQLGVYFRFQLPGGANLGLDLDSDGDSDWLAIQACSANGAAFKDTFYPKALKFTFKLRDSNGIFADGKTFTHIVYLDN